MKSAAFACLLAVVSCKRESTAAPGDAAAPEPAGALLRAGPVLVTEADLDYHLREHHAGRNDAETRRKALEELARRASFTHAAFDAGLDSDPLARAEIARILSNRFRETMLAPRIKAAAAAVPETRLREIYQNEAARFQSAEKRQLAVLWLNPGADPGRLAQYQEKLAQARDWFFKNGDLKDQPAQGFSVLSVDYSEHAASRYQGGVVGWLEREGGMDSWSKAVADIGFSLKDAGEISAVVSRPEGVFLVRLMTLKPAVQRPFEAVAAELDQLERQRLRNAAETEFESSIQEKYPAQWLQP